MGCLKLPYKNEDDRKKNVCFSKEGIPENFLSGSKKCNKAYQYYLKDHLGNTRTVFTTEPKEISFTAHYEQDSENPDDTGLFESVQVGSEKDFNRTTGDASYTNAQVLRSSPNNQVGSVLAIPVGQGDKITAIAYAKYVAKAQDPNVLNTTIANALVSAFTGSATSGIEGGTGTINDNFTNGALIGGTGFPLESVTAPKAFLNVMFLPEGDPINLVKDASFAYDQISDGATEAIINGISENAFDELKIEDFVAPGNGFVMVYVSNEGSLTDVYFDDLSITVKEHPVIETSSYYPFGMQHKGGFKRITAKKNRFKYNGKELIDDLGFGLYDYGARFYQADLGRFTSIDPLASDYYSWSSYHYAANDPIRLIDINGEGWGDGLKSFYNKATRAVSSAVQTTAEFTSGVANAVSSNFTSVTSLDGSQQVGIVGRESRPSGSAFSAGQTVGDVLSVAGGVIESVAGAVTTVAGGTLEVASLGIASPIALPAVGVGVATTVHGASSARNGLNNLLKADGVEGQGKRRFSQKDRKQGLEKSKDADGTPRCEYCGDELDPKAGSRKSYEADHRDSYKNGGKSTQDNLAPSCRDCNRSKGSKNKEDFTPKNKQN